MILFDYWNKVSIENSNTHDFRKINVPIKIHIRRVLDVSSLSEE